MPSRDSLLGELVLGRYRIVLPLGKGGMGVVYLGRTEGAAGFSRPVVVKRILPGLSDDKSKTALFIREARILSNLQHPGIVQVLDFGEEDDAYLMVLDYVHGYNLRQWMRLLLKKNKKFPVEIAIVILRRVLDALHYAHTLTRADGTPLGIVHRDISPENILLDAQGYVKLADFGIARMTGEDGQYQTGDGVFKGKLPFLPPEAYSGEGAGPRSDVYAAGVVLYNLLSGQNPFSDREMSGIVQKVLCFVPPPISTVRDDVPQGLDEVLAKALEKESTQRFESAAAFGSALGSLQSLKEEQAAALLLEAIRRDFPQIPSVLGVAPLEERDAAWRAQSASALASGAGEDSTQGELEGGTGVGSTPHDIETVPSGSDRGRVPGAAPEGADEPVSARSAVDTPAVRVASDRPAVRPASGRGSWWIAGVAFVAIIASGAALFATFSARSHGSSPQQKFLVVERNSPSAAAPADSTAPSALPGAAVGTVAPDSAQPASRRAPSQATHSPQAGMPSAGGKPARTDPAALSRSFARQHGQIQSCFQSQAANVEGQPRITVQFSIDASGRVKSARLAPASLSGTRLGQCILGVARKTSFGPQPGPVTFSIPIVARKR